MRFINRVFTFISFHVLGRRNTEKIIAKLCILFNIDLLDLSHKTIGVNIFGVYSKDSENNLIHRILPLYFNDNSPVIFDIGANVGNYTDELLKVFKDSTIYGFEPNPKSCSRYESRFAIYGNVHPNNLALGAADGKVKLYFNSEDNYSEQATIIKEAMSGIYSGQEMKEIEVPCIAIDSFCKIRKIVQIDFMKIDAEGFEFEILKGASQLIKENAIRIIQFEFNEMNVYARVFLKDFYSFLPNFKFYRMLDSGLLELGEYKSKNEIFRYQNLVAINNICPSYSK